MASRMAPTIRAAPAIQFSTVVVLVHPFPSAPSRRCALNDATRACMSNCALTWEMKVNVRLARKSEIAARPVPARTWSAVASDTVIPIPPAAKVRTDAVKRVYISTGIHGDEPAGPLAGVQLIQENKWPENLDREIHLAPRDHPVFYASQRFTLNVTREAMKQAGYSPSVRLFEAGACGTAIISDWWEGLDSLFDIGKEVLISSNGDDTLRILRDCTEEQRAASELAELEELPPESASQVAE